ncbi:unnamed protein product [Polarella glacialis]|uniref:Pentatricopeptide repeat-containing protein, chloroplastic n=1 Tax=Polarella glacialis TaxID=89957 RepID=A0A813FMG5_POLGL|nr:unnamed protein product [Polarella glacialis]CAE8697055.1 unnamed protein product [Polarella glacialis]
MLCGQRSIAGSASPTLSLRQRSALRAGGGSLEPGGSKSSLLEPLRSRTASLRQVVDAVQQLTRLGLLQGPRERTMAANSLGRHGLWQLALELLVPGAKTGLGPFPEPDAKLFEAVMSACGKVGQWVPALEQLSELRKQGLEATVVSFNTAISGCDPKGWRRSLQLLEEICIRRLRADVVSYNAALTACARSGSWAIALGLQRDLSQRGIHPDSFTFNACMAACGQQWGRCLLLLKGGPGPSESKGSPVVGYNTAISACEAAAQWMQALCVLQLARCSAVRLDAVTFNAAASACGRAEQWALALGLVGQLRHSGLEPCRVTWGAAIDACGKAKQWACATELVSISWKRGRPSERPGVVAYSSLASALQKSHEAQLCLQLLGVMRLKAVQPNLLTFNTAASACQVQWELALSVAGDARQRGSELDSYTWNALSTAAERCMQWRLSLQLLRQMQAACVRLDLLCCSATLRALAARSGLWHLGLQLLTDVQRAGISLDEVACAAVLGSCAGGGASWSRALVLLPRSAGAMSRAVAAAACQGGGAWPQALRLLYEAPQLRLKPGSSAFNLASSAAQAAKEWRLVLGLLLEMPRQSHVPNSIAREAAVKACAKAGRGEAVCAQLDALRRAPGASQVLASPGADGRSQEPGRGATDNLAVVALELLLEHGSLDSGSLATFVRLDLAPVLPCLRRLLCKSVTSQMLQDGTLDRQPGLGACGTATALHILGLATDEVVAAATFTNSQWVQSTEGEVRRAAALPGASGSVHVAWPRARLASRHLLTELLVAPSVFAKSWKPHRAGSLEEVSVGETANSRAAVGLVAAWAAANMWIVSGAQSAQLPVANLLRCAGCAANEDDGTTRLRPIFVEHDRSAHAERTLLLGLLRQVRPDLGSTAAGRFSTASSPQRAAR